MRRLILFAALALPFAEIAGFVIIGSRLGVLGTLLWVIGAAMLGVALLRREGLDVLMRAERAMRARDSVAPEMVEGGLVALAGMLLIVPGFVSDAIGAALFLRPVRRALARRFASRIHVETVAPGRPAGAPVLDLDRGEWTEIDGPDPRGR